VTATGAAASETLREALLSPRRIALVGASASAAKDSGRAQRYLRRHGFAGRLHLVNPTQDEIEGEPCHPSVAAIGEPVDHAFVLVSAARVEAAVADCAQHGVRVVTILASGFAEAGEEGRRLQRRIVATAREAGMRLLGPNSIGVVDVAGRAALSVNAALDAESLLPGPYALVSQSGSMLGAILSRGQARGMGFSKLVSTGNEADLTAGEVADLLVDDPDTGAILLFLESIRDSDSLARMAERAHHQGKPVIAYKLGRSEPGAALTVSHTGGMAGSDAAAGAFLRQLGIARAELLESFLELPALMLAADPARAPRGRRVAVMTNTGGAGAMVVDQLALRGLEPVPPGAAARARLLEQGVEAGAGPLLDVTLAGTTRERYASVLAELIADEANDLVLPVVGSSAQFKPELALAGVVEACRAAATPKPVGVFLAPQADASLALLAREGVAAFRTPESAADAARALLERRPCRLPQPAPPAPAALLARIPPGDAVVGGGEALELFAALGIEVARSRIVRAPDGFADLPEQLDHPVVAKLVSPDLPHKTEVGAVALDLRSRRDVEVAARRMLDAVARARPGARLDGVELQRQETGLAEAIVGFRRDREVGPIVVVGLGGVTAEIHRDVAVRMAPATDEEAAAMVDEVAGLAPLRGYRNLPRGDVDALARAIVAVSRLAAVAEVAEAELNPLLVRAAGQGAVAVDALVRFARSANNEEQEVR
jgi:acetate---CoA ligase (ADP-forming)